jgi:hypothetical protein
MSSIAREHADRAERPEGRRRSKLVIRAVGGVVAAVAVVLVAVGPRYARRLR